MRFGEGRSNVQRKRAAKPKNTRSYGTETLQLRTHGVVRPRSSIEVSVDRRRVRELEITDCDFKLGRFAPGHALRLTEQGVAMLSSVLRSKRAIRVNIEVMRAFVRLRQFLAGHKDLSEKSAELERKVGSHDEQIRVIFEAIRQLMTPPQPKRRPIGFHVKECPAGYFVANRSRRR